MTALAQLLRQRSEGSVQLRIDRQGVQILREEGSAKCRVLRGCSEAILINTSGGLAGGDVVKITATAGAAASLTLTAQAAERVYRTLGPPADVRIKLTAEKAASLLWMPQETILFDGSALHRTLDVDLADDASFLAVEPLVFGRRERGELVKHLSLVDRWHIRREGKLIHSEILRMGPMWPRSKASFADNHATATLLLVSPDAETLIGNVRAVLGPDEGASAWNASWLPEIGQRCNTRSQGARKNQASMLAKEG